MTPGERCDEIVRLIDETLAACAPPSPPGRSARRPRRRRERPESKLEDSRRPVPLAATA